MSPTREQIAQSWDLWIDYVDPLGVMSREEFDGTDIRGRMALMAAIYGDRHAE